MRVSREAIIGRTITYDRQPARVVGMDATGYTLEVFPADGGWPVEVRASLNNKGVKAALEEIRSERFAANASANAYVRQCEDEAARATYETNWANYRERTEAAPVMEATTDRIVSANLGGVLARITNLRLEVAGAGAGLADVQRAGIVGDLAGIEFLIRDTLAVIATHAAAEAAAPALEARYVCADCGAPIDGRPDAWVEHGDGRTDALCADCDPLAPIMPAE